MRSHSRHAAFTLLEVILALALTVVVTAILSMAIHVHLRSIDTSQISIERDQLARTLVRRIADDVRSAIRREPFDDSGLKAIMQSAKSSAANALNSATGGKTGDSGKTGPQSSNSKGTQGTGRTSAAGTTTAAGSATKLSSSDESATDDAAATAGLPSAMPGLYGTQYDLQIDIGRIPRLDELSGAMVSGGPLPSDVKSVYYFVAGTGAAIAAEGQRGLMRSEMNRAAALFAMENGQADAFLALAESLAPEVIGLSFRYFDGLEWLIEWNSESMGGLPFAVEITLVVADPRATDEAEAAGAVLDLATVNPDQVYTTTVHLPNAQLPQSSGSSGGESSDSGITDLGTSSADGSSSGGGQSKQ